LNCATVSFDYSDPNDEFQIREYKKRSSEVKLSFFVSVTPFPSKKKPKKRKPGRFVPNSILTCSARTSCNVIDQEK